MSKKMEIDQVAVRLVEIRQGLATLSEQKTIYEDEKADLEEVFKAQVKKQGITGVPTATHFVAVSPRTNVVITDDAKLLKAIKARKWEKLVIEPKLNKKELDKLVREEFKGSKKTVPGTKMEETSYVKIQDREDKE